MITACNGLIAYNHTLKNYSNHNHNQNSNK